MAEKALKEVGMFGALQQKKIREAEKKVKEEKPEFQCYYGNRQRLTVQISEETVERAKNAVYWVLLNKRHQSPIGFCVSPH